MKCTAKHYYDGKWYICGRPAKWLVNNEPCCNDHARKNNHLVLCYGRVPIEPVKEGAGT